MMRYIRLLIFVRLGKVNPDTTRFVIAAQQYCHAICWVYSELIVSSAHYNAEVLNVLCLYTHELILTSEDVALI